MKRICYSLCIILFSFQFPLSVFGQKCSDYPCVIIKVKKAIETKNYRLAFEQLESAEGYPNKNSAEIARFRKRLFDAIEKEKQDAINARDETKKQKELLEQKTQESERQTQLAKKTARQSKSKELAAKALLEFSKNSDRDETIALRLAYYALRIDSSKEIQDVFERIVNSDNNRYYLKKFKGEIIGFYRDSSLFRTFDGGSTRLYDWSGKLYDIAKGDLTKVNLYSLRFLIPKKISLIFEDDINRLTDWAGGNFEESKAKIIACNLDSSRFLIHYDFIMYLIDKKGNKYGRYYGDFKGYNKDSSRFWVFEKDSACLIDWNGKIYTKLRGYIEGYTKDSSRLYASKKDSIYLIDRTGDESFKFKGKIKGFNKDSSLL